MSSVKVNVRRDTPSRFHGEACKDRMVDLTQRSVDMTW